MSVENDLKRIADGVEAILGLMQGTKVEMVVDSPKMVAATEAIQKVIEKVVEPTEEEIRTAIREFMNKNDKDKAIELLIKYGAKAEKPMIKDVTNKAALMREIM